MSFFDNKEEVIKINLTQFGKYLLSKGKFNPKYYAFYDDDVIYDSKYINLSESQNDTEPRILNNTPLNKPQIIFTSVENSILDPIQNILAENTADTIQKEKILISSNEINDNFLMPIGKNSYNSEYAPAWNLSVISGSINSINLFMNNSDGIANSNIRIPQINMNTGSYNLYSYSSNEIVSLDKTIVFYNNDVSLATSDKDIPILLDIIEKNVDDLNENFEIEVFKENQKTLSNGSIKKFWERLSFFKKPTNIKDNILLDEEIYKETEQKTPDLTNVEYYFELLLDDEIDYGVIQDKNKSIVVYGSSEGVNQDNNGIGNQGNSNAITGEDC